jgi:hypothetical protein
LALHCAIADRAEKIKHEEKIRIEPINLDARLLQCIRLSL